MQRQKFRFVSNNSAHRWTPDVPMMVPELNPEHAEIIPYQRKRLGTKRGFYRSKAKLLNPELYTGTSRTARV